MLRNSALLDDKQSISEIITKANLPYLDECRLLILAMIGQTVRDYINFQHSSMPSEKAIYEEACEFLFDDEYVTDWGGVERNLGDFLDILDIDIDWFREHVVILKNNKIKDACKRRANSVVSIQLEAKTAYLAGPMEFVDDNGLAWRLEYRQMLEPLNIQCIVPNEEESQWIQSPEYFQKLKKKDLVKYIDITRQFMKQDLNFTLNCDYFICHWEGERIHGTTGEAQWRWQNNKNAYLVTSKPLHEVPGWFLACFTKHFETKEQLVKFLENGMNND